MAVNSFNAQNPPVTTKGDVFTFSTIPTRLGVGANDTVLTADSTAATGLKWATPASGSLTQLATGSLSGNSTSVTSISGSYTNLVIRLDEVDISSNGNVYIQFNSDTGSNYRWSIIDSTTSVANYSGATTNYWFLTTLDSTTTNAGAIMTVYNYADTSQYKPIQHTAVYKYAGNVRAEGSFGGYVSASAITSVQFIGESTRTLTGTYFIYGAN